MTTIQIATQIQSAIEQLWPTIKGGDGVWTQLTFEALQTIGSNLGYESRYSQKYGGPGEWLWDFVWLECDQNSQNILSLPLVVESEWTLKEVRKDFEKLLSAYAPLKLIILQAPSKNLLIDKVAELKSCSRAYFGASSLYVSAGWVYRGSQTVLFESWSV